MRVSVLRFAWLCLIGALAIHVIDEAATGFLDVYNPTVTALRDRFAWFPIPTFRFGTWLTGLAMLVILLAGVTPLVERGPRAIRAAAVVFAGLMVLNGAGHVAGTIAGQTVSSVQFARPMPGFWSSPLLVFAPVTFIRSVRRSTAKGSVGT
jgi:hypothetical protein